MTIDLTQLVFFGIVCSASHWLIARSAVGRPIWSRAVGIFAKLLACAGCSGFWLGAYYGGFMIPVLTLSVPTTSGETALWWIARFFFPGVLGVFVTPVFEGVLMWGLRESALSDDDGVEDVDDIGAVPQQLPQASSGAHATPVHGSGNPFRKKTP